VGREDQRLALLAQLEERLAEDRHVHRVEARERLVHQQDLGIVEDRGDQLDLLLVALRELVGAALGEVRDAEPGEPVIRLAAGPIGRDAVELGEIDELVDDPHPRVEAAFLGQVAPGRPRQGPAVGAAPVTVRIGLSPGGRSASSPSCCAVRAEGEHLAAGHVERGAVERDTSPKRLWRRSMDRSPANVARHPRGRDWADRPGFVKVRSSTRDNAARRASPTSRPASTPTDRQTLDIIWQDGHDRYDFTPLGWSVPGPLPGRGRMPLARHQPTLTDGRRGWSTSTRR
jgi:hypothetical protein